MTLAKGLGLRVTAEGVETREQYDALLEMGSDWAQGYFFHRPMPLGETMNIIESDFRLPE